MSTDKEKNFNLYENSHNNGKTRHLPITEYYKQLQREYIITELRKKIYPKIKDKNYYERVLKQKRINIEDISSRNKIPSIFNDINTKDFFYKEVYPEWGFPIFTYKDDYNQREFAPLDLQNYYMVKNDFKFKDKSNQIQFGILTEVNFKNKEAKIKYLYVDKEEWFTFDVISRLL